MTTETIETHHDLAIRDHMPAMRLDDARTRFASLVQFVKTIMRPGVDFGNVGTTDKPTLLKPGAEKLCTFFGLTKRLELVRSVEDWSGEQSGGEPLFYYVYRCALYKGAQLIAESEASANSRESKYRWRWVRESEVPAHMDKARLVTRDGTISEPAFAVAKKETTGKYGKPAAYWQRFEDAIADGTAREITREGKKGPMKCWAIGDTLYRVPNDDIPSIINTIQKMAQKRALVGSTLLAVNASEFFTQDIEDLVDQVGVNEMRDVFAGEVTPVPAASGNKSSLQDTIETYEAVMASRGFSQGEAQQILATCAKKSGVSIEQADGEFWKKLFQTIEDGKFDHLARSAAGQPQAQPAA